MEDLIREAGPAEVRTTPPKWRALSIFVALTLVVVGVVLAKTADSSTPKSELVTNVEDGTSVVDGAGAMLGKNIGFGAPNAQFTFPDIRAIVCPILNALAAAFGQIIGPVINALRVTFGCISP